MSDRAEWPKDGRPAKIEDLSRPFRELFLRLYPNFDPANPVPITEWNGHPVSAFDVVPEPDYYLSEQGLRRKAEDGLDALDLFIDCVIRVGMEQGRRTMPNYRRDEEK